MKNNFFSQKLMIVIILVSTTLILYWQVSGFDFVGYDDSLYISLASKELTWDSVAWSFLSIDFANWHPLTWLSLILDYNLYGSNAAGYHITNLVFHIANTLLLFLLLNKMTGALYRSAFVAALFALHPLHVESVAWISERKDVLSTLFLFLTMWAYVLYAQRPNIIKYFPVIVLFAFGLMAKPMLVTLPFVLLLLDYWPLHRIKLVQMIPMNNLNAEKQSISFLILEKVPLFVLTILSSIVTHIAQSKYNAVVSLQQASFPHRILNAFNSYAGYLKNTFWFQHLGVFYPYPRSISLWEGGCSILLIGSLTLLAIIWFRKAPYLPVGWFWFLGTLVPVIGLIQVGFQAMADRYTYVPLIGIFIVMSWGLTQLFWTSRYRKWLVAFAAAFFMSMAVFTTYHQVSVWKNNFTLFGHVMKFNPNNYLAYNIMGFTMAKYGDDEKALHYYYMALKINPEYDPAYINAGIVLQKLGRLDDAIYCYKKALQINHKSAEAEYNLGIILMSKNKEEEAIDHLNKSLKIKPGDSDAHNNLGVALMRTGNTEKALVHFQEALRLNQNSPVVQKNIAITQAMQKSSPLPR